MANGYGIPKTIESAIRARAGDHAEHGDHHAAHRPARVDRRLQHSKAGALLVEFVNKVQDVAGDVACVYCQKTMVPTSSALRADWATIEHLDHLPRSRIARARPQMISQSPAGLATAAAGTSHYGFLSRSGASRTPLRQSSKHG
jgi:hypothetical protein